MPDITIRAMGASGVNVDTDPLLLSDSELRDSQNLYQKTSDAQAGGLRNRPGFTTFIAGQLSGPVLGGIGMAVKQVARATGAGPGGTGGTGPGDGGPPGGTGPGTSGPGPGTGPWTPPGPRFGGARLVVVGRGTFSNAVTQRGDSWFINSENWADTAIVNSGPASGTGPNVHIFNPDAGPPDIAAGPAGAVLGGYLYYAAGINTSTGNQRPQIRRTNGFLDEKVVTVPRNSGSTGTDQTINQMHAAEDGNIWFTEMTRGAANKSRLFKLNPNTKALTAATLTSYDATQVGSGAALYALGSYNGRIIVGTYSDAATGTAVLWPVLPTASGGIEDLGIGSLSFGPPPERNIGCIQNFDQTLYVGTGLASTTGITGSSNIYQMSITATGTWTATSVVTGSATGASGNYFPSMCVFKSKLYATYYNPGLVSIVYQYDGTTWTGVQTLNTGSARRLFLFVDKDTLYSVGPGNDSTGAPAMYSTTNGTSWTTRTANFPSGSAVQPVPVVFGFEQTP